MTITALDHSVSIPSGRLAAMMAEQLPSISVGGFPVAGQPLITSRHHYTTLLDATARLLRLQLIAVSNLASDSLSRRVALKADPAAFPRFTADEEFELAHAVDMARADVIIGPDGPRFIEFNVGGGFAGMVQFEVLRRLWRDVRLACGQPELTGENPFVPLANLVKQACARGCVEPAVLVLTSSDDTGRTSEELRTQCHFLREQGVSATFADVRSISPTGILSATQRPVVVVQFSEREALDEGWDLSHLLALIQAGVVAIPSQSARLVDSKKVLALLSEGLPWMSEADHALVRRFVPWTRVVRDRVVRWRDRNYPIRRLLHDERRRFLLKGSAGLSGKEVTFGAHCAPQDWAGWWIPRSRASTTSRKRSSNRCVCRSGCSEMRRAQATTAPWRWSSAPSVSAASPPAATYA